MSGIAGFINHTNKSQLAENANKIQFHRGPDQQRNWEDKYISLSQQFFHTGEYTFPSDIIVEDDQFVLIFDGEIYNQEELIYHIQLTDSNFSSYYDAEIILKLFRCLGVSMLKFINGMFAIAIYNKKNQELFLARDHFGVKPLFYTDTNNGFAFSSELKTLLTIPGFEKTINEKALVSSLNYVWVSGQDCMFKNAFKLAPAHYCIYSSGIPVLQIRYWDINDADQNTISNEESLADHIGKKFKESVLRRLKNDKKVSCFLSGGLDSSLVSAVTHEKQKSLSTYTIGFTSEDKKVEKMPDDEMYASYLANYKGFDHNKIEITADIIKSLPDIVRILDEPIGDPAAINTYLICKAVKEKGVNVMLAGVGSDEIFMGHRAGKATIWSQNYFNKLPSILQKGIVNVGNRIPVMIGNNGFRFGRWAKRFLSFVSLPIDQAYMRSYSYYSPEKLINLVTDKYKKAVPEIIQEHKDIFEKKFSNDPINQICYTDINMFLVGLNLTYTDRASMAASVRIRMPFVDKCFIEESMRLQGKYKLRRNTSKYILKIAAKKFIPSKIINRPKAAFSAPIRSWISKDLRSLVDDLLSEVNINKRGILNYSEVKKMIDNDRNGLEDNAYHIYQLLTLELWFKEFIDKNWEISTS